MNRRKFLVMTASVIPVAVALKTQGPSGLPVLKFNKDGTTNAATLLSHVPAQQRPDYVKHGGNLAIEVWIKSLLVWSPVTIAADFGGFMNWNLRKVDVDANTIVAVYGEMKLESCYSRYKSDGKILGCETELFVTPQTQVIIPDVELSWDVMDEDEDLNVAWANIHTKVGWDLKCNGVVYE